jgi:hypothetical protein
MTMPMEGVLPAVLSPVPAADLDDYLSFRHVFRRTYGLELRGERIMYLPARFPGVAERFRREIEAFPRFLRTSESEGTWRAPADDRQMPSAAGGSSWLRT